VLLLLCACNTGVAQKPVPAHEVEAAYLLNFLRYTQWPAQSFETAQSPYVVAVVGDGDAAASVRAVAQAAGSIYGRTIEVRALRSLRAPSSGSNTHGLADALAGAHLVYFDASAAGEIRELPLLADKAVLTVSNAPGFIAAGGMIELVNAADHIIFDANPAAIAAAQLVVSSKVLKLARTNGARP